MDRVLFMTLSWMAMPMPPILRQNPQIQSILLSAASITFQLLETPENHDLSPVSDFFLLTYTTCA